MTIPKPFALINRAVGGGTMGHQVAVVDDGYLNIPAVGLNNVGLLVCVWGNVTYVDPSNSYFYIDDGSGYKVDPETGIPIGIRDGSGSLCIQVASTGLSMPAVGDFAKITGISGVAWVNGNPARLIRPRSSSDLTYITPTP